MARKPKSQIAEGPAPQPAVPLKEGTKANAINAVLIDVDQIVVTDKHDRAWTETLKKQVAELAASMAERGLQQPIRVHERGFLEKHGGKTKTLTDEAKYALTFGELRLAAAKMLGWKQIPATIGAAADVRAERAIENLQRPELGVGAKMVLVSELVGEISASVRADFGVGKDAEVDARTSDAIRKRSVDIAQTRTGMRPEQIRDLLFLCDLDETTRTLVLEERLPWQYARKLAAVADPEVRAEIANRHAAARTGELPGTLRDLEDAIARVTNLLDHVPWKLDVAFADAPACKDCPNNSINQTGLFEGAVKVKNPNGYGLREKEISAAGVCLKDSCYRGKLAAFNRKTATVARKVALTVKGKAASGPGDIGAPDWAKEDTFKRQVREKAKLKVEVAAAPQTAGGTTVSKKESPEETARKKAADKLRDATRKWRMNSARPAMGKALKSHPATRALLIVLQHADVMDNTSSPGKTVSEKSMRLAEELIDLACAGTPEAFGSIMTKVGNLCDPDYYYFASPLLHRALLALGAKVAPPPALEDFLPKAEPKKPAAKKADAGGKRAAPASGKKKAKKSKPSKDAQQAAADMAADAAGEIDPQEEV